MGDASRLDASGRVAFVAGAGGGIGAAVVEAFLSAGAHVAGTGRDAARLNDPTDTFLPLSMAPTDESAVQGALEETVGRFGRLDYAVNMVGIVGQGKLTDMSLADWQNVLDINLNSCFLIAKRAYEYLKKSKGTLILCSSTNGLNGGSHLSGAAYACSKAAIINLNRYLAKEWAADGIRVNCVVPGPVDTPMLDRLSGPQHEDLKSILPLKRYATAEEVAGAVSFLCSPAAAAMTGTFTNISSGLVLD